MNPPRRYVIGVDVGTTSTKAVVFEEDGRVVAKHHIDYPLLTPQPSAAEQDPEQIYFAVLTSIKNVIEDGHVDAARIACVSFSSAMHSLIAFDKQDQPITRCITWADNRSAPWADRIKRELGGHAIYLRTGTPIHPMSPLSKLCWLRDTQPAVFTRAARFISIKEYVFFRLFGCYIIDHSIASATGLFNLAALEWDPEALKLAGITADRLSKPVPTTHMVHGLKSCAAQATGLHADTPFIIGASDGVLANLGANAIDTGVVAVTIGTSGAVRTVVDHPYTDPQGRTFCYALTEKRWVIGGSVNNGGIVLRWLNDIFSPGDERATAQSAMDSYEALIQLAAQTPPGANGLIFHPYLTGERAPLWNASARGSFFGLALHHRKKDMVRAALEGVIYNLYGVLCALESLAGTAQKIHATGGFARSELWRQMMSDIFNRNIDVPVSHESSCLGAAVLGLYALGRINSLGAVSKMVGISAHYTPDARHVAVYAPLLAIYSSFPVKLQDEYECIAKLQN
jgi:gluconokinase